jgi:DNA invertase Pin-like site-specific DNA recombinase
LGEQGLGGALSDPHEDNGGLEAARTRGRKGGRKLVMDEKKLTLASAMLKNREIPVREVCEAVGVSRSTLYRHLKPNGSAR